MELAMAVSNKELNPACCACCDWCVVDEWENHTHECCFNSRNSLGKNFYISKDLIYSKMCDRWEMDHNLQIFLDDLAEAGR